MNTKRLRKGFTLIELLIVIAIIGVLAALVVGVCVKAEAKAQRVACQSNLRQLGLAMRMYLDDNSGRFPIFPGWTKNLLPYASPGVFQCPIGCHSHGDPATAKMPASFEVVVSDYYLNGSLRRIVTNGTHFGVVGINESVVLRPTETFMIEEILDSADADAVLHSGGANYCFVDGHVKWLKPADADALRDRMHGGGGP